MNIATFQQADLLELSFSELEGIDGGQFWAGVTGSLVASAIWAAGSWIASNAPSYREVINSPDYMTPIG